MSQASECLISDSNNSDDCEDDIAVADVAVEEDSEVEEEGQGHSLGDTQDNSGFIWGDMGEFGIKTSEVSESSSGYL
jgi:hypothetical protein